MPRNSRLGGDGAEGEDVAVAAAERLAGGEVRSRIQSLSHEQCQEILGRCLLRDPSLIFDVMACPPPDPSSQQDPNLPDWCVCMRCREMPTDIEKKCCGQPPQHCISLLPHVDLYVLHEGVLRMARRIWNDLRAREDAPHPGEDNKQFRYAAYRQFVVWQYGYLGRGNRIVIPSCCVWKINKGPLP
ncbi:P2X purinoceptor 7 [Merluccius polli]|uniref:P2X purinoceptor 7 n=1 Tax=Merluccius polli TaxID=89951 RepID=A0AA47M265_MERPO|nr:P2X purinoceptor 7 [Merluccius polli]